MDELDEVLLLEEDVVLDDVGVLFDGEGLEYVLLVLLVGVGVLFEGELEESVLDVDEGVDLGVL